MFRSLIKNPIHWALIFFLISSACLHVFFMSQMGFMSDDYALIASAQKGSKFWHLHYSPVLEFFWRCTASGKINALHWHLATLSFHFINTFLLYLITFKRFHLSQSQSLLASTLFMMSPGGIEALAWTCSAGYVLTVFWILVASYYFLDETHKALVFKACAIAFIQLVAFLTWDWGALLFPILAVFALVKENPLRNIQLLLPTFVCWVVGIILRNSSEHGTAWQNNSGIQKVLLLGGAPFLGFFPNFDKDFYLSILGIGCTACFMTFLLWTSYKNRWALAALICFFGSIWPWVNGANPSSRYFYLSMVFIYVLIAIGGDKIKKKALATLLGGILLFSQFYLTYERSLLWNMAFKQSLYLKEATERVITTNSNDHLVIVNIPEAYGPEKMPMRPQLWHCGFSDLFPQIKIATTSPLPSYVWHQSMHPNLIEITSKNPNIVAYEVVYRIENDWREFALISLK